MHVRIATLLGLSVALPLACQAMQSPISSTTAGSKGVDSAAHAAARLAEQLKRHPAKASSGQFRRGLFLMDLDHGDVTMIADEPDPGADSCGSPRWSHDGRRILFDCMPNMAFHLLRIKAIDLGEEAPRMTDLGPGARPTFSPDDRRISFLLHDNAVAGAESGVWVMQADGSQRRRAGYFGMPLWSPDDSQFLVVGFNDPRELKLVNLEKAETRILELSNQGVFGWPSWADAGTVAAIVGSEGKGDSVALIDVKTPPQANIKGVLWKRGSDLNVSPLWPVYSAATRRCIFVGVSPEGMALYVIEPGASGRAKRLEAGALDNQIGGLCFSPDGKFLLFCSTRRK
jgi:Tol biopolymer transport system component